MESESHTVLTCQWYQLGECLHTPLALPVDLGFSKHLVGNVHAVVVIPDVAGITLGHLITFLFDSFFTKEKGAAVGGIRTNDILPAV